ncbi:MAG TPA: family 16 glycoside hydrolase, partial [Terriglobales bacterium]|nr:family 16 glycoside hydrolase [Terriglobales bacterium]
TVRAFGVESLRDDPKGKMQVSTLPLDTMDGLEVLGVSEKGAVPVKIHSGVGIYRGRRAVRLVNDDGPVGTVSGGQVLAIIKGSDFEDGIIEADIAGFPRQGAKPSTRGFIGVAFRVQDHGSRYEAFYLRMTNGRADDQLRRNHSAQYMSQPEFPWNRLRQESPGVYESYVDIDPEAWTKIKVVVSGRKAQLYVNGADRPCLIVNDLKLGAARGQIALWTGSDTEAYFSNLTIR